MNYGKKGVRAKQRALNAKTGKLGRKLVLTTVKLTLAAMIGLVIFGAAAGIGIFKGILSSTPEVRVEDVMASGEASIVYDCEGNEIDQYVSMNSNRILINSMDRIPEHLGQAFIALEDRRFYQHNGIDLEGIARSGWTFIKTMGKRKEGASTITQQLLKNTVFTTWTEENNNLIKMVKRKLQEQSLALEISKKSTKDEVLLRYMNAINLGQNTLGVESASLRYFGKSCSELTLSECAVIASITQNPTRYNPIRRPEENAGRREKCLNNMLELEFITKAEYDEAMADTEAVYQRIEQHNATYLASTNTTSGSYFSDALYEQVLDDLVNIAGYNEVMAETLLNSGGLRIYSTMDPAIQTILDEEFANPDNFPAKVKWYLNYALTIFTADGEKHNFSMENMMSWFKANQNKKFNMIFASQDDAEEAIVTYRTAMLAELGVADDVENYTESKSLVAQPQAAMVVEDQSNGYVVAMMGGRGAKEGRRTLNRAVGMVRSPGSTFKVVASFAPALDSAGQTLATVYEDAPFSYNDGTPVRNYYKTGYRGINSIRIGIRDSMNIVAVKALTVIGPRLGYDYLLNFGFTSLVEREERRGDIFTDINQTLAIGGLTDGVSPYELNAAYAAIANMGTYNEPKLYSKVTDVDGNVILDNTVPNSKQVIKETTAYLLTSAMEDVLTSGTGTRCRFSSKMATAGKTGTSTEYHDVWFAGYTPYYTCTVWGGYDNNIGMGSSKSGDYEINIAKDLWRSVMKRIHENLPDKSFTRPQGIVSAQVCTTSGLLPVPGLCDGHVKSELFAEGTVPTESCNIHYEGWICDYDRKPASPDCPFKVYDKTTLPLVEDPSLWLGTSLAKRKSGSPETVPEEETISCVHDATFFANPDYEAVIYAQTLELMQRRIAAGLDPFYNYNNPGQGEGETGIDPGTGTGVDPGTGTGVDPGTGTGVDPGTGTGVDPGTGTGVDPGTGTGVDPGTGTGVDPGTGTGVDPGAGTGADPNTTVP